MRRLLRLATARMMVFARLCLVGLGLIGAGASQHTVGPLQVDIDAASCAVTSLGPANVSNFSFTTAGFGDIMLRTRSDPSAPWGAMALGKAGTALSPLPVGELAACSLDIDPESSSLHVEQHFAAAPGEVGGIVMSYTLTNTGAKPLEVGGFAVSMPSNEQTGGSLAKLAATASFADPYIGAGHAHLSMTRLTGEDGVLLIVGENGTAMEAFADQWSPLAARFPNAWVAHSAAFAAVEWAHADGSWVNASSATIPAGGTLNRSFRILLAEGGVQGKAAALEQAGRPIVVSVPGYVLGIDMTSAKLFVKPPAGAQLSSAAVVNDVEQKSATSPCMTVGTPAAPNAKGWVECPLTPSTPYCRCRVELRYSDGSYQVVSYFVLPGLDTHLAIFGKFQSTGAYYDDETDPFGRAPSVMPYNRAGKTHVLHDPRNFIVGLSDEAGAGANVGFAIKQCFAPVAEEVAQLDRYINSTLWGVHCPAAPTEYQTDCSLQDHATHGIKASLFWTNASASWDAMSGMPGYKYEPEDFTGWKWDRPRAYSLFRA